ncbi:phosphatidate cytidylyltransferase [Candidatus Profftia tarda]|uniref:phosphatidate cytidylyltransferase n=1 Tax=Candidatus Profftia tarda TaxID=1177216 RepID=UPI001C1F7CB1|nr:phosphatidate cytidylyltransferase [Candidatus Profftia tarda]
MLKSRIITTVILVPSMIISLFMLPPLGFAVMTLIICMLAAWEWGKLAGFAINSQRIWCALFFGLVLVAMLFSFYVFNFSVHVIGGSLWAAIIWWMFALLLVLFYPKSAVWWKHSRILKIIFGAATIVPFFGSTIALRQYGYKINSDQGIWCLLYIMVLVWCIDSSAYMFGNLFGKNKISPKISPGKTWEGFIGSLTTSTIISWVFSFYAPPRFIPAHLIFYSIIVAMSSMLGDLTESMFKREAGIKDSSFLIPGHGGILDRIDSLTAAVPVFAFFMLLIFD